ncbi:hypothetical protein [Candidatus Rhabdochlamydia porcellionis]|uniref:Uncharacterized protein n=1 Tax=Candidatus Rhabdochlamydia porcellionis TaxID=225148 RepID=A0ABX8Z293_9BACT|nr:hypothetical protein [Candidatus Rhabdochlamydia porcellionis]QZA59480.1 hypothetical protein RHAB15C_0001414 [Candidatus Rhabdochlamydia porcellionis]
MAFSCDPFPSSQFGAITITGLTGGGAISPDANGNFNLGGSNISVVGNSATNTLSFTAPGASGVTWIVNTDAVVPMSVNTGYIDRFPGATNYMLPATSSVGDVLYVVGTGLGYEIHLAAGQSLFIGTEQRQGPGGFLISENLGNSIYLVATIPNTEWRAVSVQGTFGGPLGP